MRIWVVLPAYNEEESLPVIFDGLALVGRETYNLTLRVLVVDDGSSDRTAEVAASLGDRVPVEVVRNERNLGLAATFRRGMVAAAERAEGDDVVVCMDADSSHVPGQIVSLVGRIREGRDVVIASRYREGAVVRGVPLHRRFLSRAMALLFGIVFPIPGVRDYSCGFRAYRARLLQRAIAEQGERLFVMEGFACMVGILLRLHKQGAVCGEVPIVLRYDHKPGSSKMRILPTVVATLGVLLRERFTKAAGQAPR